MNFSSNSKSDCIALVEAFKVSFRWDGNCRAGDAVPLPSHQLGHGHTSLCRECHEALDVQQQQ